MKIVVTAQGSDLNAPTSPRFGRCPTFVFVETETLAYEAVPNPAAAASGGAGIQAAQFIVERGAQAVLTGNVGPNAADVFEAGGVPIHLNTEPTVKAAVEAFKAGKLPVAAGATVKAHAGMSIGRGRGLGQSRRQSTFSAPDREEEIAVLKSMAADLRRQLTEVIDRIEKLEEM
jgi:predicted Fe-Mo cluster-binding NifX family protein